jgi:hypothetical protein
MTAKLRDERQPQAVRGCDGCRACCSALGVGTIDKPTWTPCPHECEQGCAIYDDRPGECRGFDCLWTMGLVDDPELRPDRSGVVFYPQEVGGGRIGPRMLVLTAHEVVPGAARRNPARRFIAREVRRGRVVLVLRQDGGRLFMAREDELLRPYADGSRAAGFAVQRSLGRAFISADPRIPIDPRFPKEDA